MKVRFAHKYQAGAAIAGTLGADAVTAGTVGAEGAAAAGEAAGSQINPSTIQELGGQAFGKYGAWAKFGLDALDVGTDFLAQKVWEKQAKEKVRQMRDVKDAIGYSQSIRAAAAQQASLYDKGGVGALAYAGAKGLQSLGMYQPNDPNYAEFAKRIGQSFGTALNKQLPALSKGSNGDIYYLQNDGVPSSGTPAVDVTTKTGGATVTNSANQTSANPYNGYPQAAKRGTKLIRRFK